MKRFGIPVVAIALLALVCSIHLASCKTNKLTSTQGVAESQPSESSKNFAFGFKLDGSAVRLDVKNTRTVLSVGKWRKVNPDDTIFKLAGGINAQYQSDVKVLFVGKKRDVVQVSILPPGTSQPKINVERLKLGKREILRLPGNTDKTYMYVYWVPTKGRIYEVKQEVESRQVPSHFKAAVESFQEVK